MKTDTPTDSRHIRELIQAIRAKCLDCSDNSPSEVDLCPVQNCPLYPYRLGKHPDMQQSRLPEKNTKKENLQMSLPLK